MGGRAGTAEGRPGVGRDPDAAREQYEQVLAIEPEYVWVRDFLLPGLEP